MAANFLTSGELGSDSDDEDYVPDSKDNEALSEEEEDGDEEVDDDGTGKGKKTKTKKKQKKNAVVVLPGRGALFEDAEDRREEFEKEKEEKREEEEKKKLDDLWADFKKDSAPAAKRQPTGSGLGSLANISRPSSIQPTTSTKVPSSLQQQQEPPRSILSSIFETSSKESSSKEEKNETPDDVEKVEENKVKITQVFDFAGETVSITKEVDKDSKEAKQLASEQARVAQKRSGGLSSIMTAISGKKKKMGCLDKSKLDWDSFVTKEGLKEDLEIHNKGKDGYVEKQAFLERADVRRFELEKEARDKTRKTLHK